MEREDFFQLRRYLGKTQTQIAQLLGVSPQAVHSFEQGWRKIPAYVERQMLLLIYLSGSARGSSMPCWKIHDCPVEWRSGCAAWKFNAGHLCWFINGTFCNGEYQQNWDAKMMVCRQCKVFRQMDLATTDLSKK